MSVIEFLTGKKQSHYHPSEGEDTFSENTDREARMRKLIEKKIQL
jgi:hypothetical protein